MPAVQITLRGPLFQSGMPKQVIDRAIDRTISELVAEGEKRVKQQLYVGHGVRTGFYRRSIHGELLDSRHGIIHDSKVVYGPWLEGTSRRNETTRFKGYAMFRNAVQGLQEIAPRLLNKHIRRASKELS